MNAFATRRIAAGFLTATTAQLLLAACSPRLALADSRVYRQTLRSTVWVVVRDGAETSVGTGVLVDRERKLVLTNGHVVGKVREATIVFPKFEQEELIAEREYYVKHLKTLGIAGRVMASESRCDLALIELASVPEEAPAIEIAERGVGPGDVVHSIGNPTVSGGLWTYTQGLVRNCYRKKFQTQGGHHDMRVLETQSPINPGDSGGPVVNDNGQLVGLTHSLDREARLMSFSIDVREVRAFLAADRTPVDASPLLAGASGK